jgi:hypothetical protein
MGPLGQILLLRFGGDEMGSRRRGRLSIWIFRWRLAKKSTCMKSDTWPPWPYSTLRRPKLVSPHAIFMLTEYVTRLDKNWITWSDVSNCSSRVLGTNLLLYWWFWKNLCKAKVPICEQLDLIFCFRWSAWSAIPTIVEEGDGLVGAFW